MLPCINLNLLQAEDTVESQVLELARHKMTIQNNNVQNSAQGGGEGERDEEEQQAGGNGAGPSNRGLAAGSRGRGGGRGRVGQRPAAGGGAAGEEGGPVPGEETAGLLAAELDPRTLVRFFQGV